MMKKFLFTIAIMVMITCSAAALFAADVSATPQTQNTATPSGNSKKSAALLGEMLDKYNPEDFLSCRMYGNPEPVKDKPDTFNINIRVSFNEKFYKESFLPDLIKVLDQIAVPAKKKDCTIAVYSGLGKSDARFYKFNQDETIDIEWQFEKFHDKINSINGVELEFFTREKQSLERINKKFNMIFLIYINDNIIKPAITVDGKDNTNITIPFTVKMSDNTIPSNKEISSYLLHAEKPRRSGNGWLGIKITSSGNFFYITDFAKKSPAYDAGLRQYDGILSINGHVLKSGNDFVNLVGNSNAGDVIVIEVQRVNERKTFSVTLGTRPE